jgi:signal transduction histidine kinase
VGRQDFGRELNYVSPWRYFLDHFCEIADSALERVQMMKREEKQIENMLHLYSTIGGSDEAAVSIHEMRRHAQSLMLWLAPLLEAERNDGLQFSATLRGDIHNLQAACSRLKQEINRLQDMAQRNQHPSCSLNRAVTDACKGLKDDLKKPHIEFDIRVPPGAVIGVPHGIAMLVIKTILVNAKEALQDYPCAEGRVIRIKAKPTPAGNFNCDITDNGPGVSEDVWPTILKQVSVSTKNGSQGVGLLYSRLALIKLGGDIINLGQRGQRGASFRIEFPRAKSSPGDQAEPREDIAQAGELSAEWLRS